MRGVANDRRINFFQDSSVAVYVDGVYSPVSYGLDGGMFDVERIEVARGPQGTTGGQTALTGSVSFVTKKPTDEWDLKVTGEVTDQNSYESNVAFGGPIGKQQFLLSAGREPTHRRRPDRERRRRTRCRHPRPAPVFAAASLQE